MLAEWGVGGAGGEGTSSVLAVAEILEYVDCGLPSKSHEMLRNSIRNLAPKCGMECADERARRTVALPLAHQ